jgi:hypothetical protein
MSDKIFDTYKGKRRFRIRYIHIHSEAYHKDYVAYLYQQNKILKEQLQEALAENARLNMSILKYAGWEECT